ncbi:CubicO group peptidase, beta-lactamase class C family [Sphingomonas gellani]|uniref:CubicO group peptidase, beta-lactamase class C family n=1 Tax=Sphingomonas gellani TaxID=1166340 RepID=A0A1H8ALI8_9SPHN|nr:serine hydrolase [Sphingomonas gellani]SEM71511.1 CubicO group peptidase, beta-lactamase class C family [Sphingomonas gellani]
MKRHLLLLPLLLAATPALADPPAGFDARVEAVRRASETPGMAVAIVENGKVVLAKGYGIRKLGAPAKVDADTLFMIGSTGKAFTSAALATLVDAGKIGWDDKVIDHLPGFQMYDPWVTREMTIRDLLVHRSGLGLGAGDLLLVPRGKLSRAELVRRLRYLPPATSFRSGYAYDNILYVVAGAVIEAVSGQPWEDYMRDHVFRPAGLPDATADMARQLSAPDRAHPHGRAGGTVRGTGPLKLLDERDRLGQAGAPAGLIAASANDMARWLQIQLAGGALPDGKGRLYSEAAGKEMWAPVTPMPIEPYPDPVSGITPGYQAYALGWDVRDYHGAQVIWHAGGLFGFTTVVVMIPEKKVGFAIAINSEEIEPRYGLMYELLDHYLGVPAQDWPTRFAKFKRDRIAGAEAAVRQQAGAPAKIGPSLPVARYAGRYVDPWYGALAVTPNGGGLKVDFTTTPGMTGRLEHYQYDTFVARFDDSAIEPAYLTFGLDAEGKVSRITAKPVSPIADFSFDYKDLAFVPEGGAR